MTQLEAARKGIVTDEMKIVAADERIDESLLIERSAKGQIVIPKNINHNFEKIMGIGKGLRTKINANIGTSGDCPSFEQEMKKLDVAIAAGADSIMDLSTGGDLMGIRRKMLERSSVMVGAVPLYAVAAELADKDVPTHKMDSDTLFKSIEEQCRDGVDYITVHCGITMESVARMNNSDRIAGVVSRGGSILTDWIRRNGKENPLYAEFDRLLEICYKYDVSLSLGDGYRPGAIADATDRPQIDELIILGELAKRSREANVQVFIEGPGHVPLNQIETNMILQKRLTDDAPFYILGPLPTDIAPGYDHITSAIGGAIAGAAGADFLCYVTPSEHLCLPDEKDVHEGVVASKIAAHIADIAKGVPGAMDKDIQMSKYRKALDWEGQFSIAIDPKTAREKFQKNNDIHSCTMCGKLCSMDLDNKHGK